jgi:hypothetical protein
MTDPRYPIGRFVAPDPHTDGTRADALEALAAAPEALRRAVAGLDDARLDTPYREGGWTARQVVHHVADSHLNAYARHKLAWAEERPTIRPYDEAAWARSAEASSAPVELSLELLAPLHRRWVAFLRTLPAEAFAREFFHPGAGRWMSLDWSVAMYAWHGRHHAAHVTVLREARGW